tara:strand:+ start:90 stop:326 length:237 start_codon:yes stop_codon:yes gene_type:complete
MTDNWLSLPEKEQEQVLNSFGSSVINVIKDDMRKWFTARKEGVDSAHIENITPWSRLICNDFDTMVIEEVKIKVLKHP